MSKQDDLDQFNLTIHGNRLVSNNLKLGLFIGFQIPSIICHVIIIYNLIRNRALRNALYNHVILVLLIVNLFLITTDLSITFHFLRFGFIDRSHRSVCFAWNFLDSFFSNLSILLMAWASIERYILIFHDRLLLDTQLKRFLLHYFPIIMIILYTFIFYTILTFFDVACSNTEYYIYDELFCGKSCYAHEKRTLSSIEYILHKILPTILIFIFSCILLVRVLWRKRKRHQIIRWRQHRRMTIQLVSISLLYFIGTLPSAINELVHLWQYVTVDSEESAIQEEIFLYLFYFTPLILPFICLLTLPEIYLKIVRLSRSFNNQSITKRNQVAVISR